MNKSLFEQPAAAPREEDLLLLFDKRLDEGIYRVNRAVYSDPQLFELEMERIFEGSWVFLTHESLIPKPFDFITTWMGRRSVFVQRNREGEINGFLNACPHRGSTLCRTERGNRKNHACTYHGWTFDADGTNVWMQRAEEGYPADAVTGGNINLVPIAKVESYRGFVFGSLNSDVPTLKEHLGSMTDWIDLLVDQSPNGITLIKGHSSVVYRGNWKFMLENGGGDGLHPDYGHKSLLGVAARKKERAGDSVGTVDVSAMYQNIGRQWAHGYGHTVMWFNLPNPEDRPNYRQKERLEAAYGQVRADCMVNLFKGMCIYPNFQFQDAMATYFRIFRPISVDRTEITFYCVAQTTDSPEDSYHRLRQFEEFFMGSGMGTPDDNAEFEECQVGATGAEPGDNFISFGIHDRIVGQDEYADKWGMKIEHSGPIGYEGSTMAEYDEWLRLMSRKPAVRGVQG